MLKVIMQPRLIMVENGEIDPQTGLVLMYGVHGKLHGQEQQTNDNGY